MKRIFFAVATIAAVLTSGWSFAQEANNETEKYEHLKVLEPLVGEWRSETTNEETGASVEWHLKTSWSETKNTIVGEVRTRRVDSDADARQKEWVRDSHIFYSWNASTDCLEYVCVRPRPGQIFLCKVQPQEKGVFAYSPLREGQTGGAWMTMTSTENELIMKIPNAGIEWPLKKVK